MALKKSDLKMFEAARKMASTSDFPGFKMGCVLVYNGHIIGQGANTCKTNPTQKFYNRYRHFRPGPNIRHTAHCETIAVRSVPYTVAKSIDWKKVKCYVYRIAPGKPLKKGMARPCDACRAMLKDRGIKDIYYTTDDSMVYERLD